MGVSKAVAPPAGYPTYTALPVRSERPSDYEIASSRLLYYPGRGFETNGPMDAWYARYQQGSPLKCDDWERFSDPQQTTYSAYTVRARDQERALDQVIARAEHDGDPGHLASAWCTSLSATLGPLRYPLQGMHMLACYVGQMAPSGRIAIACLFQAGHELRRIDRLAYRTRQLVERAPDFAQDARQRWETEAQLQPLRETIERLLISYDWGEAFVGLNLCLKPLFDGLVSDAIADRCAQAGDEVLAAVLRSFKQDAAFQKDWSRALVATVCVSPGATPAALASWCDRWSERVVRAIESLARQWEVKEKDLEALMARHREWLASLPGLRP